MHDRRFTDAEIERLQAVIAQSAEHEAALWGSPKGDGLIPSVRQLAASVAELAKSVAAVTDRVIGEDGMTGQIKDLRREIATLEQDLSEKHQENLALRESDAKTQKERQDRQRAWLVAVTAPIIIFLVCGLGALLWRAIIVANYGVKVHN